MKTALNLLIPFCASLAISAVLLYFFIPVLRKVKLGQKILEIGPSWHKCKEGTPILGGLFFLVSTTVTFLLWALFTQHAIDHSIASIALLALSSSLIGFVDDYVKLFKKRNKGLSAKQKLVLQFASAILFVVYRYFFCNNDGLPTSIRAFGLFGAEYFDLGWLYFPLMVVLIVYVINCANLNDGVDGLCGSVSFVMCLFFVLASVMIPSSFGKTLEEILPLSALCASLAGGLIGYLIFNFHPAKIFMGDTGSLFLGGFVTAVVIALDAELLLIPITIIWIIEGISVMLQVVSFKLTGKRIFRMAPIHHHFEMGGWSEVRVVLTFAAVTLVACALSFWAMA